MLSTALSGQAIAQDSGEHLGAEKAKIFKQSALSSNASSRSAIAAFIAAQNGDTGTGPTLVEDSRFQGRNGVTHIRLHQEIDGIPVHGAYVKVASRQGRLTHLIERTSRAKGNKTKAAISAEQAISIAVTENFGSSQSSDFFSSATLCFQNLYCSQIRRIR